MNNSILNKRFRYSYSNVALVLVCINVFVFILTEYTRISIKGLPLIYWLSLIPSFIDEGFVWQFLTYMFVHSNISHLFFNMLGLLMFGMMLERNLGSKEFLLFYLLSGFLSGVLSYLIYKIAGINPALLGASGAIYSLLFLFAVMYPNARILLFFFIPLRAPVAVAIFAAMCIFNELFSSSNTANMTHLAGFAVAWIYCLVRFRINPIKVWRGSPR